jgi:putative transport protein
MSGIVDRVGEYPLLVLFAVVAGGQLLGRLRVGGVRLGVAGVLFVGLAVGGLDARLALPEVVLSLGLGLFVYCLGLSFGPGFTATYRRAGLRPTMAALAVIAAAAGLCAAAMTVTGFGAGEGGGLFSGALTNTPALAAAIEWLGEHGGDVNAVGVGYSLAYPGAVLGAMTALAIAARRWRIDPAEEAGRAAAAGLAAAPLVSQTLVFAGPVPRCVADLHRDHPEVVFSRVLAHGHVVVALPDQKLEAGDLVHTVGPEAAVAAAAADIGGVAADPITVDRRDVDVTRVIVSNASLAGRRVGDLGLSQRFGATVTRVRRGDVDLLASDGTVLEPGDVLRVVAPSNRLGDVGTFFGDSLRGFSEVDVTGFAAGLTLGFLVGMLSVPLPGGGGLRLGMAGGPLLVGLLLGARQRTGPLVWQVPHGAGMTLRQLGTVLFLAAVGTRSGDAFVETLASGDAAVLLAAGAAVSGTAAVAFLAVGRRLLRLPFGVLSGMLAGLFTQPAVLAFACEQAGDDSPSAGYAAVCPAAMVAKIVAAQLLVATLT